MILGAWFGCLTVVRPAPGITVYLRRILYATFCAAPEEAEAEPAAESGGSEVNSTTPHRPDARSTALAASTAASTEGYDCGGARSECAQEIL